MELAYQDAMDMANRDALTNVKNKRAYAQAEAELDRQIENAWKFGQPKFAVVVCDLNGLKQINDTHGHKAGDDFIRAACSIICNVFKHSPVFRIGGDEFAVLLNGADHEQRQKLMAKCIAGNNLKVESVVLGDRSFSPEELSDVFERADKLMYADKVKCKNKIKKV